jgi:plasmid stabilization system protein ParE
VSQGDVQVYWSPGAKKSYRLAWRYIARDSKKIANSVFDEIDHAIDALVENPARYPADPNRKNNAGDFRAFEIKGFRIAYQIADDYILVVRFRHVKQKPRRY